MFSHPGYYNVRWNGKDKNGQQVGTGVYVYYFKTDSYSKSYKMLLIE